MSEWRELKTLQAVAAAQAAGEEIEYQNDALDWTRWNSNAWFADWEFRSRPRKKVKTVVLREALCLSQGRYWREQTSNIPPYFVKWLDTQERVVEVEDVS